MKIDGISIVSRKDCVEYFVLFVDDEINVLNGLKRSTRSMRNSWNIVYAESADKALACLDEQIFDVVISDLRMPGMDGAQLLDEVRKRQPNSIRIVLSGHADMDMAARSTRSAHRFLTKPCSSEDIVDLITRALNLRSAVSNPKLHDLAASTTPLPSLPLLYQKLTEILADPDCLIEQVSDVISQDISMSGSVLKMVNSSFFRTANQVDSLDKAVILLGTEVITSLVIGNEVFSSFKSRMPEIAKMWERSVIESAIVAKIFPLVSKDSFFKDQAMTAAMLQYIGDVVLFSKYGSKYQDLIQSVVEGELDKSELEIQTFGFNSHELGSYILSLWGLSDLLVEAIFCSQCTEIIKNNPAQTCLVISRVLYEEFEEGQEASEEIKIQIEEQLNVTYDKFKDIARSALE